MGFQPMLGALGLCEIEFLRRLTHTAWAGSPCHEWGFQIPISACICVHLGL